MGSWFWDRRTCIFKQLVGGAILNRVRWTLKHAKHAKHAMPVRPKFATSIFLTSWGRADLLNFGGAALFRVYIYIYIPGNRPKKGKSSTSQGVGFWDWQWWEQLLERQDPTQNPEIPKKHRVHTTFSRSLWELLPDPCDMSQEPGRSCSEKNLFRRTFIFWVSVSNDGSLSWSNWGWINRHQQKLTVEFPEVGAGLM